MSNYSLFSVLGIEIEYMLVDRDTLAVQPKSDRLLQTASGQPCNEIIVNETAFSNELIMHVLELKNNGPKPIHAPVARDFQAALESLEPQLETHNLMLLPTAAHPWMNPQTETKRWPYDNHAIYTQFDALFNCNGHGWSNLQSMHVNLPFEDDQAFGALHTNVRLLLPLLPALAASSPILDGEPTGYLDTRLHLYGQNQRRFPSISGHIIPEPIQTQAAYQEEILNTMYHDIKPFDPEGILQHEWLNSRGAIPKFESMTLEIRVLDTQECVHADIAIAHLIYALLKHWHESDRIQATPDTRLLKTVYDETLRHGLATPLDNRALLTAWQLPSRRITVGEAWSFLIESISHNLTLVDQRVLEHILSQGNLSERILRACHGDYSRQALTRVYRKLADCLRYNQRFSQ